MVPVHFITLLLQLFCSLKFNGSLSLFDTMKHTKMHVQHRSFCYTVWMLHLSNSDYSMIPTTQLSKQNIQSAAWCSSRHLNQLCTSAWQAGRLANSGLVWFHRTWILLPQIKINYYCNLKFYIRTLPQLCISSNLHVETCSRQRGTA